MRILVVEDDFASRRLLCDVLAPYGVCHAAADGREGVEAVRTTLEENQRYDLICLDIQMPNMDGQEALKRIRALEEEKGILPGDGAKIIMTTVASDRRNILQAFSEQCEAYLVKPIDRRELLGHLKKLGLIPA
jgi:two-component system chemotaxis response regulator CheY